MFGRGRSWAQPLVHTLFNEQIITAAAGSATSFVVTLACTTIGYAVGTSAVTGATSIFRTAALREGLSTYFVRTNACKWMKDNAGKSFINSKGKIEIVRGLAFIYLGTTISPLVGAANAFSRIPTWSLYVIPPAYYFVANYISTRRRINRK